MDLPNEALAFECRTWSVYPPGTVVQMVGIGLADAEDCNETGDPDHYIRAQCVHVEDSEGFAHDWHREWWYFGAPDLRPLTPAAEDALAELRELNR